MKAKAEIRRTHLLLLGILAGVLFAVLRYPLFPLQANEPTRLKDVKVQGNLRLEAEAIRLHIKARKGDLFDPTVVGEDVKAIYRMGYFDDVRADFSPEGILTYRVKEGPSVKRIEVQGNVEVSQEKIESALGIKRRTILDQSKVMEGVERVRKLYVEQGYARAQIDYAISEAENNQAIVLLDVVEGGRLLIKKISFEGNQVFSDDELADLMATKEEWLWTFLTSRGVLDQDVLTNDLAILSNHYYDYGYINFKIDDPIILKRKDGMEVVIRLDEGDQFKVGKVEIGGDLVEEPETLLGKMELTSGQIFRGSRLRKDIETLSDIYADRGFAFAQVVPSTRMDAKGRKVNVALVIHRGSPVYFDRVEISGNTKTRDKVIRREMALAEQELFSVSKIKQSQNSLMRTGYFKDVQLKTERTDKPDTVNATVEVQEGPTGAFNVGAGFSTANFFTFSTSVSEDNLFGKGQSLTAAFNVGTLRQNITLSFVEPYLFDSRLSVGADVFNNTFEFSDYDSRKTGFGIKSSYPLKYLRLPFSRIDVNRSSLQRSERFTSKYIPSVDYMRGGVEYIFSRNKISDIDSDAPLSIRDEKGTSVTSSITPNLVYDSRDHFFTPTEGAQSALSMKIAGLGGDNHFLKTDSKARWYYPVLDNERLGGKYTLVLGGSLGYGVSFQERFNEKEDLPLSDRYFPGGLGTVRGFGDGSLGPREEGEVVGGDKQVIMNVELQFPLLEKYGLKGVTFFDQGQAFSESEAIDPGDFRRSVGIGARWLSPLGPLRLEFGFPLNKEPEDDTSLVGFALGTQ